MTKRLILLVALFGGIGTVLYLSDSNLKTKFQGWLGIAQADSVHENTNVGTTLTESAEKKKPAKKRAKIPKIIKDEFASLDKYAKETPAKYSQDNATLARYLEKPARNDLEKARLIYSWIATHIRYDDDAFNTGKYSDETAGSVLVRRKAVCEGFSSLYEELGLLMGLEVEKIHGYAKGYGYQPGYKFSETNHAWNAVKINDTWKLIDVTWGSSESETTTKGAKSTMRLDPYWFCVKPEEFIFSHLPENEEWQLTHQTITSKQYENLPFLRDSFFKLGFDAEKVFQKAISGEITEFVETFPVDYPIASTDLPILKKIQKGKEHTFSIESEYLESVAIVDGGIWIYLKGKNNVFKITYTPNVDKLYIVVKFNWYEGFSTMAVYEIVDGKSLTIN